MIELFWFLVIITSFCVLTVVALGIVYCFGGSEIREQIREEFRS